MYIGLIIAIHQSLGTIPHDVTILNRFAFYLWGTVFQMLFNNIIYTTCFIVMQFVQYFSDLFYGDRYIYFLIYVMVDWFWTKTIIFCSFNIDFLTEFLEELFIDDVRGVNQMGDTVQPFFLTF